MAERDEQRDAPQPTLREKLRGGFLVVAAGVLVGIGARVGARRRRQLEEADRFTKGLPKAQTPESEAFARNVAGRAFAYGTLLCGMFGVSMVIGVKLAYGVSSVGEFAELARRKLEPVRESIVERVVEPVAEGVAPVVDWAVGDRVREVQEKREATGDPLENITENDLAQGLERAWERFGRERAEHEERKKRKDDV